MVRTEKWTGTDKARAVSAHRAVTENEEQGVGGGEGEGSLDGQSSQRERVERDRQESGKRHVRSPLHGDHAEETDSADRSVEEDTGQGTRRKTVG